MPVSRGRKIKSKPPPPPTQRQSQGPFERVVCKFVGILGQMFGAIFHYHWKLLVGISVVIGLLSAVLALIPRVTVDAGELRDSSKPFSLPLTIANNNFIPLERVGIKIGICNLQFKSGATIIGGQKSPDCSSENKGGFIYPPWQNHKLGIDGRWQISLDDFFKDETPNLNSGDITIIVSFTPWPWAIIADWPFRHAKQFRLKATMQADNKWHWLAQPIDRP